MVITFDHHPDEVITGSAPPLLCDPDERLARLAAAGVDTTVVVHFDRRLRETPYDAFVAAIAERAPIAGFLMTPDAAFGYERAGTPEALAALGAERGFDVVVVPPFELDGRPVRSSEIRAGDRGGRPRRRRGACSAGPTRWWGRRSRTGRGVPAPASRCRSRCRPTARYLARVDVDATAGTADAVAATCTRWPSADVRGVDRRDAGAARGWRFLARA